MNWRGLCTELAERLAEHVPADDPLLAYARHGLGVNAAPRPHQLGHRNPNATLTPERVRELRRLRADGLSYGILAIRFGISKKHACRICSREAWGWLE